MKRGWLAIVLALALSGCGRPQTAAPPPPPPPPPKALPTPPTLPGALPPPPATGGEERGGGGAAAIAPRVRDSVYLPVDRATPPPSGYGLYTVLLARTADRVTVRLLSELFTRIDGAAESAIPRIDLNLITLPVKKAREAGRMLATARDQPAAVAGALMREHYDFGEAALLMAAVCQASTSRQATQACGSPLPDGPLLVTGLRPLDGSAPGDQRLLVVNLAATPPDAVPEVLAAYRRQILRGDFSGPGDLDSWRLWVLDHVLDAANLLPVIRKAYAATA